MTKKLSISKHNVNTFSLTDTLVVKGLAIILLLYHHCFLPTTFDMIDTQINFFPVSQDIAVAICYTFKLCVGMFVFLTGYGLFWSINSTDKKSSLNLKSTSKWIANRLIKTLNGFWFIYVLTFVITFAINQYPVARYFRDGFSLKGISDVVIDFLGLSGLFNTTTLIGTWWYMSAAVVFILLLPILFKLTNKVGYLAVILLIIVLPRLVGIGFPGGKNALSYLFALLVGMAFAKYNLFEKLGNFKLCKNKSISDVIIFIGYMAAFVALLIFINKTKREYFWEIHFCLSAILVICFCKKFIAPIPILRNVLYYLGKHSMNIYLIHTFIRYVYLTDFIYSFKWSVLIHAVLLLISLAISIVFEYLKKLIKYDKLINKITSKVETL